MIEIPCTLRCDKCGTAEAIMLKTKLSFPVDHHGPAAIAPLKDAVPAGWQIVCDSLQCPRCNGFK